MSRKRKVERGIRVACFPLFSWNHHKMKPISWLSNKDPLYNTKNFITSKTDKYLLLPVSWQRNSFAEVNQLCFFLELYFYRTSVHACKLLVSTCIEGRASILLDEPLLHFTVRVCIERGVLWSCQKLLSRSVTNTIVIFGRTTY